MSLPELDLYDISRNGEDNADRQFVVTLKNAAGEKRKDFHDTLQEAHDKVVDEGLRGEWKPTGASLYVKGKFRCCHYGTGCVDRIVKKAKAEQTLEQTEGYGIF